MMFAGYLEYLELLVFTRVACVAACLLTTTWSYDWAVLCCFSSSCSLIRADKGIEFYFSRTHTSPRSSLSVVPRSLQNWRMRNLKEKYGSKFTLMQYRIWGEMITGGLHEDSPNTTMFARSGGGTPYRLIARKVSHLMSEAPKDTSSSRN